MIFNSLWPLVFLAVIPIIIILYLLKPKGKDERISSNVLWEKLFRNHQSKTFFEKFVHNILMYLQILIELLLIFALMAPFIRVEGKSGGNVIMLIDVSGSMQQDNGDGKTRLEESVQAACDYVDASDNTNFTVITCDSKTSLIMANSSDKARIKRALREISCTDIAGNLSDAQSLIQTLYDSNDEGKKARLLVFTDGSGAKKAAFYAEQFDATISVAGKEVSNISLDYTAAKKTENGYDLAVRITNYSDYTASMDVSIYGDETSLLGVKQVSIPSDSSTVCIFKDIDWKQDTVKASASGISFLDASGSTVKNESGQALSDSLPADNVSYAVKDDTGSAAAVLVGDGNTYIEKAYAAITGNNIIKSKKDDVLGDGSYNIAVYDAGTSVTWNKDGSENGTNQDGNTDAHTANRLVIKGEEYKAGSLKGVMLKVPEGDLTTGLSDFQIGVNEVYYYDIPDWAKSFITYDDKCVGYYGDNNGTKEIVIGFDLRESDFPLCAEFPIFMANAVSYLSDTSVLAQNVYYPGETVAINPSAKYNIRDIQAPTDKAGLYSVTAGEQTEYYVVRFPGEESDGRIISEGAAKSEEYRQMKVRKNLRNILLVAALILLMIEWMIYVHQMKYRGKFYLVIRIVGCILVLLAVIGIVIPQKSKEAATIFVIDLSESNEDNVADMEKYLKDTLSDMPKNNKYGIITFGKDSCVEQFLTETDSFTGFMTEPQTDATNYEEAISRALAMLPADQPGRIVVLTDGRETKGNIHNTAAALSSGETELEAVILGNEETKDAYIENVTMPTYLHPGDEYSMTVTVISNYDTDAEIRLYSGSSSVMAKEVHLSKGTNQFVFKQTVTDGNMESFKVVVTAPDDTCEENNEYSVYSMVEAAPKILLVSGLDEDSENFKKILAAAGADYNVVSAINAPDTMEEMLKYKSIILENVYIDDLPDGFLANLDSYVKDYGCGLVCCGGEDSFALGGYRDSVIEDVLPVDMEPRGVNETPSMAMVMVIDHSGSMLGYAGDCSNVTNLDLAIQAATGAVDNLRDSDYVGVLTFDDTYTWQVPITQASDKEGIKNKIKTIRDGGGTTIKPALEEAYKQISQSDAVIKHIVLLTDGMGETTDFNDLTEDLNDGGITLSTVAVGEYSDTRLLEELAEECKGRYYYSDLSSDIPKIFAQEVFLSGETYIQNGDFSLAAAGANQLVAGLFPEGWPNIYGYIAATPKQASTIIIATEKDDPVLTTWQYGLGKTVAWNTDVTNQWTGAYAGNDDYVQMWKRIIDYTAGSSSLGADSVDVANEAGSTVVRYQTDDFSDSTTISAVYQGPDGEKGEVTLICTAPGEYEAVLDAEKVGIYNINVRRSDEGEITNAVNTAAAVQFSDEYRFDVDTSAFTGFIRQYGKQITYEDRIWTKIKSSAEKKYDLTELLIILAILLFLADIAFRRFHYVPEKGGLKKILPEGNREERKVKKASVKKKMNGASADIKSEERSSNMMEEQSISDKNKDVRYIQGNTQDVNGKTTPKPGKRSEEDAEGGSEKKEKKRVSGKQEKKKAREENQILDTSSLLKKKEDRNL